MATLRCMNCMDEYNEKYNKCPHCGYMKAQPEKESRYLLQETVLQRRYVVGNVLRHDDSENIYIGWDQVLEKRIAVKEYFPVQWVRRSRGQKTISWVSEVEQAQFARGMEQFVSEAQQLARFREETGMVRIYDSFQENGTAYTIIEYSDNLREIQTVEKTDSQTMGKRKNIVCYIGLCAELIAIAVVLILLLVESNRTGMSENEKFDYTMIPDMTGMSYQQAEQELNALGIRLERDKYCMSTTLDEDIILSQSLAGGTSIEGVTAVNVVVTKQMSNISTMEREQSTIEDKTEWDMPDAEREDIQEDSVTTEEVTVGQQATETTIQQEVNKTSQPTTQATTKEKTTRKKKETTEKKTEKKTKKEKKTEKSTTEEVIVIEE